MNGRPDQMPPGGDWSTWLLLAGRGFGKTRTGAEWVRAKAMAAIGPGALVAPTAADARDVIVEGPAGILAISPESERPLYEPSKRRLTWPNGVTATLFSADEPDRLRGPQHAWAWLDEFAAYADAQTVWDMMSFGLRLGDKPQALVTTTPRPKPIIRALIADPLTTVTRGRTRDNEGNLAPAFVDKMEKRYAGTRLGRQELDGEVLDDTLGALWTWAVIERCRARNDGRVPDQFQRVAIGVDPSGSDGETGDSQGIVVAGLGYDGKAYVLEDGSVRMSPDGWARVVKGLYDTYLADRVVAEKNYGGAMVEAVLRTASRSMAVTMVTATRGKHVRAEPVAALYEQDRVVHVRPFPELEEQMTQITTTAWMGEGSPDRLDALVWVLTDLMIGDGVDLETWAKLAG